MHKIKTMILVLHCMQNVEEQMFVYAVGSEGFWEFTLQTRPWACHHFVCRRFCRSRPITSSTVTTAHSRLRAVTRVLSGLSFKTQSQFLLCKYVVKSILTRCRWHQYTQCHGSVRDVSWWYLLCLGSVHDVNWYGSIFHACTAVRSVSLAVGSIPPTNGRKQPHDRQQLPACSAAGFALLVHQRRRRSGGTGNWSRQQHCVVNRSCAHHVRSSALARVNPVNTWCLMWSRDVHTVCILAL